MYRPDLVSLTLPPGKRRIKMNNKFLRIGKKYRMKSIRARGKLGKKLISAARLYTSDLGLPLSCLYNRETQTWDLQPMSGVEKDRMIYVYLSEWENKIEIWEVWFGDVSQERRLNTFDYADNLGLIVDFILKQFNW